ncbi:hypothetical protein BC826DRAFT_1025591 [Russula brevipes]|nr:hypothetical protein BC826DRAFT_1025591 [Russula brevipes]
MASTVDTYIKGTLPKGSAPPRALPLEKFRNFFFLEPPHIRHRSRHLTALQSHPGVWPAVPDGIFVLASVGGIVVGLAAGAHTLFLGDAHDEVLVVTIHPGSRGLTPGGF